MVKSKVQIPKSQACIAAFQNDVEVVVVENFKIENKFDRVLISGDIEITRDKHGLENILSIKRQVDCIASQLKSEDLPDAI